MAALALSRRVLVTSHTTLRTLVSDFAVPAGKITVAEPGTERARAPAARRRPQLLAVGSIVPRKAYDLLVRALAPLAALDWQLTIIGATDRSSAAVAALGRAVIETGLGARIAIAGPLAQAELAGHYDPRRSVVMPSL